MATTQLAYQLSPEVPKSAYLADTASKPHAIDLEFVSVSQLLGRDYIFIDTHYVKLPDNQNATQALFEDLVKQLGLAEAHTVIITFEELNGRELSFTRHDLSWYKHKICRVESFATTKPEQQEFMNMIWQCSTPASL